MASDDAKLDHSPTEVVVILTAALKKPRSTISNLGPNITLPKPVDLWHAVLGGCGGFAAALLTAPFVGIVVAGLVALPVGWLLVTAAMGLQPLRGESLTRWFTARRNLRRHRIALDGEKTALAVGMARMTSATLGAVHQAPGCVTVAPGSVDHRGARVDHGRLER